MSLFSIYIIILYIVSVFVVLFARAVSVSFGNLVAILIAIITFSIAAVRPEYFPDVDTYELMYDLAQTGDFQNPLYWASHGEPGFKILAYLMGNMGMSYFGFLVFMAALSNLLLVYIARLSTVPFVYLWFTYFSCYFVTRDLGVLRLSIASHLIIIFLIDKSFVRKAISIGIASLSFQTYAFITFFAKPLSRFKVDTVSIVLLFIFAFAVSDLLSFSLIEKLFPDNKMVLNYQGNNENLESSYKIIIPIMRNLIFSLLILYLARYHLTIPLVRLFVWAAFLSVAVYIATKDILVIAQRFSAYFGAIIPLALAFLMQKQVYNNNGFLLIVLLCTLNFASNIYYNDFIWRGY